MAENNTELDAINHLLEVEKKASSLISDAMQEADKRISLAHLKYNSEYKTKYDKLISELDEQYEEKHDVIESKYKQEIEDYKTQLGNKTRNEEAFNSLLEKLLLA